MKRLWCSFLHEPIFCYELFNLKIVRISGSPRISIENLKTTDRLVTKQLSGTPERI